MHKKGITEEVAKKRSRRTVKHQRGIVGADLAAIAAKRNQTAAVRSQQRLAAITKAKSEKKDKEVKKAKVRFPLVAVTVTVYCILKIVCYTARAFQRTLWPQGVEAADEGWKGRTMSFSLMLEVGRYVCMAYAPHKIYVIPCTPPSITINSRVADHELWLGSLHRYHGLLVESAIIIWLAESTYLGLARIQSTDLSHRRFLIPTIL